MKSNQNVARRLLFIFGLILTVGLFSSQVDAGAGAKTLTVSKVNQESAKKLHKLLLKGESFTIRMPGNKKSFIKKLEKLSDKTAKCTDVGFDVLPILMSNSDYFRGNGTHNPKESRNYTTLRVRKNDCQEYIYGIKFAEREYQDFMEYIDEIIADVEMSRRGISDEAISLYQTKKVELTFWQKSINQYFS